MLLVINLACRILAYIILFFKSMRTKIGHENCFKKLQIKKRNDRKFLNNNHAI